MADKNGKWVYSWKVSMQVNEDRFIDLAMFRSYMDAKRYAEIMHNEYTLSVIVVRFTRDRVISISDETVYEY